MGELEKKSFDQSDEVREMEGAQVHMLRFPQATVGRYTMQPGWRWSSHVGPNMGLERCPLKHMGVAVAGTLRIEMEDGSTLEVTAGDVYTVPPGHDAVVVGDDTYVAYEFNSDSAEYFSQED